ncbi:hypothetical protein J6590_004363 [Homalodisca vitripennis]|nr:hypothetical protein J6590_004363 [Homalodisca vitripennis]
MINSKNINEKDDLFGRQFCSSGVLVNSVKRATRYDLRAGAGTGAVHYVQQRVKILLLFFSPLSVARFSCCFLLMHLIALLSVLFPESFALLEGQLRATESKQLYTAKSNKRDILRSVISEETPTMKGRSRERERKDIGDNKSAKDSDFRLQMTLRRGGGWSNNTRRPTKTYSVTSKTRDNKVGRLLASQPQCVSIDPPPPPNMRYQLATATDQLTNTLPPLLTSYIVTCVTDV